MLVRDNPTVVIGRTLAETKHLDWIDVWPELDEDGMIIAVSEGEYIPEDARLFWDDGEQTDGMHGFDYFMS